MIEYSIDKKERDDNKWVIHKIITTDTGMNIYAIYKGQSKKECQDKLKEIKKNENKNNNR